MIVKPITVKECEQNYNYKYIHEWLNQVSKYMTGGFDKANLEYEKKIKIKMSLLRRF